MRILTLDTATNTGWCLTEDGLVIAYGLIRLDAHVPPEADGVFQTDPFKLAEAERAFSELVARYKPDFVVIEQPHLRGNVSFFTVAIYGIVELVSARAMTGFYAVHTQSWQSKITPAPKGSKGSKKKGDTKARSVAHVRGLGIEPETDDVADAICIAEYAWTYLQITGGTFPFQVPAPARRLAA